MVDTTDETSEDKTLEQLATVVRRIAARELDTLDKLKSLSDDDVKRLAVLALVLQRSRPPTPGRGEGDAPVLTDEQLMRKAG